MTWAPGTDFSKVVEECLYQSRSLTRWESDFLASISEQLDRGGYLSEKQQDVLERIHCKL